MTTVNKSEVSPASAEVEWSPYPAKLQASPYQVAIGETVQVTGSGFTAGAEVELVWHSVIGRYVGNEGGEFIGQRYEPLKSVVATARADGDGNLSASFAIPVDFGGTHDIRAEVDGQEVAQTGVIVTATWSISPAEGPIGTVVEVKVTGLDCNIRVNTWHLLWDNRYVGMMTGVTTKGVGIARFRAAGPLGVHHLAAWRNSHITAPYLAGDYSPLQHAGKTGIDFQFRVTEDAGPLETEIDDFVEQAPPAGDADSATSLSITPNRGVVNAKTVLSGSGYPANTELRIVWFSMFGASVMGVEPTETRHDQGTVKTAPDGTLSIDFEVPDDLGGSHRIGIFQGEAELASTAFVILPSVVSCTPEVRAGERVDVHLKGVGWTEYDKNYAVTYDNSYIGYVCALSTNGDIRFRFTATGEPGTHLLDLYPMIYKTKDPAPVVNGVPNLTYIYDHPIRRTPGIRLSIQIKQ